MILLALALMFGLLWYLTDKNLKGEFQPWLKWGSLAFIALFVLFEAYLFLETDRMISAREISATDGIKYSYYDNSTNTTKEFSYYALQGSDSAMIFQYHAIQNDSLKALSGLFLGIGILLGFAIPIQFIWFWYTRYAKGD